MTGGKKENGRIVSCECVSVHNGSAQILHQTEQTEKWRKTENVQKLFFKHENVIISKLVLRKNALNLVCKSVLLVTLLWGNRF